MSALLLRHVRRLVAALLLLGVSAPFAHAVDYTTTYRWDLNRRLEMTISADTGTGVRIATKNTYNLDGQITKIEKGTTTSTTGSPFTVLETTTIEYDAVGNKIKQTTPAAVTQFKYDDDDKLICTALRMNEDEYGSLTTDACALDTTGDVGEDRVTKLTYDAAGQKLIETRGYGTSTQQDYVQMDYTPNGKLDWSKDANANRTEYVYDGFDRLCRMYFPVSTSGANQANTGGVLQHELTCESAGANPDYEGYGYDQAGNRTSLRKRSGNSHTLTYQYDALNREISKDIPGGTAEDVYTAYDLLNHKLSARFVSTSGNGIVYEYDKAGRLKKEISYGRQLSFDYDQAGNRTRITYPDTTPFYVDYTYDALNRVGQVRENGATSGLGVLASYAYDALGRRDALTRSTGANTDLSYDSASRLSALAHDMTGSSADVTLSFVYAPSSQIVTRGITNTSYHWSSATAVNATYVPDGLNRYSTVGGVSYTYDARGNLTGDGTRAFTYDLENRLLDVDTASVQTLALSYDPNGRLKETVSPTVTTQFLYDGDRLVAEYDGSTLLRRYVHGPGVDEPLVWYDGSGTSNRKWLISDNQGSVIGESDSSGATTQYHRYDAYGQPQDVNWNTGSRFRYTGQIALIEAKLYHYKARVYDPTIGRFLQTDPIGYEDTYNLYAYVGNDPGNNADPTGEIGLAGAAIGAAVGFVFETGRQLYINNGDFSRVNGGTVLAATVTGAAIGATAGLATGVVALTGATGIGAAATVALPVATVAATGAAVTTMVDNKAQGAPIPQNVLRNSAVAAAVAPGGAIGANAATQSFSRSVTAGGGQVLKSGTAAVEAGVASATEAATRAAQGVVVERAEEAERAQE